MSLKEISKFVGYVPVSSDDCFSMPVVDSILVGMSNKQKWRTTDKDLKAVYRVMKLLKIEDLAMRGFNELSAGQHQKVSIARGLVQEPEILILDEPTSNLDIKHQVYVTELLRTIAIKQNIMILMISHDINISAKNAHKIIVMSEPGIISMTGSPNEVIAADMIRDVYGVDCTIVMDGSRPHIMLGSTLDD
jgi:iron complex transport system ATP-binding protein